MYFLWKNGKGDQVLFPVGSRIYWVTLTKRNKKRIWKKKVGICINCGEVVWTHIGYEVGGLSYG